MKFPHSFLSKSLLPLLAAAPACKQVPQITGSEAVAPEITLAFITGLKGTLEGCGCQSTSSSGQLERLAALVERLRQRGPLAFLVVGDTFFPREDSPADRFELEQKRAETIAAILARLEPAAVLPGPNDLGPHAEQVRRLIKDFALPAFAPPKKTGPHQFRIDSAVRGIGGVPIGLLGAPGDASDHGLLYGAGAAALRAQKVGLVLGMVATIGETSETLLRRAKKLNVAITGGRSNPAEPRLLDGTLVVDAGDGGRHLGLLRLRPKKGTAPTPGDWVYDDQRRTHVSPDDPSVELPRPPPSAPSVTWEALPVGATTTPARWATELVSACGESVRRSATACGSARDPK